MKKIITYSLSSLIAIYFIFGISGCRKDDPQPEYNAVDSANAFLYQVMHYWYLWNDEVPELDPTAYSSPLELLEVLKYSTLDKWSFIGEKRVVESLFEEGEFTGYGFYLSWDSEDKLRIAMVYEDTEAYTNGIRRSNELLTINNTDIDQINDISSFISGLDDMSLEFIDTVGIVRNVTLTKKLVSINSVLSKKIIEIEGTKVGYLVYDSFLEFSEQEVTEALAYFKQNEIDEFVLDLRYNGGGSNMVMKKIADILIQPEVIGKVFYTMHHNDDRSPREDTSFLFETNELNLGLDRLFVITTSSSASASEALINGLEPHMDVIQIGSTTHGKPVGMYQFNFGMWSMLPVSILNVNANGEADFFDGLEPDVSVVDDVTKQFGDETELCLAEALYYIRNNDFSTSRAAPKSLKPVIQLKGLNAIINSF